LETLTAHQHSVKDDFLNTRYFSHYDQKYGKPEVRNEAEEAIKTIEQHLQRLRGEFEMMSTERGIDVGELEEKVNRQRYELERKAQEEFEKLINDKNRLDQKGLIIDAYEGVLYDRRRMERDILNGKRFKEHEKNRPPEHKWYMLKDKEFSKELYRNRMALKPNDSNYVYL
jgi:molybdopterin converting factor small subunit